MPSSRIFFRNKVAYACRSPVKLFIRYITNPWRHRQTPREVMSYCNTEVPEIRLHVRCSLSQLDLHSIST
jgi:hypothetical protein